MGNVHGDPLTSLNGAPLLFWEDTGNSRNSYHAVCFHCNHLVQWSWRKMVLCVGCLLTPVRVSQLCHLDHRGYEA